MIENIKKKKSILFCYNHKLLFSLSLPVKALACTAALEFTVEEATCSPKLSFLQLPC